MAAPWDEGLRSDERGAHKQQTSGVLERTQFDEGERECLSWVPPRSACLTSDRFDVTLTDVRDKCRGRGRGRGIAVVAVVAARVLVLALALTLCRHCLKSWLGLSCRS